MEQVYNKRSQVIAATAVSRHFFPLLYCVSCPWQWCWCGRSCSQFDSNRFGRTRFALDKSQAKQFTNSNSKLAAWAAGRQPAQDLHACSRLYLDSLYGLKVRMMGEGERERQRMRMEVYYRPFSGSFHAATTSSPVSQPKS